MRTHLLLVSKKAKLCLMPGWRQVVSPVASLISLEHILLNCTALHMTRYTMYNLCHKVSTESDELSTIVNMILQSDNQQLRMQFYSIVRSFQM